MSAKIKLHRVLGHCVWATVEQNGKKLHSTREVGFGNDAAALDLAQAWAKEHGIKTAPLKGMM
jgi:hypothetical protein